MRKTIVLFLSILCLSTLTLAQAQPAHKGSHQHAMQSAGTFDRSLPQKVWDAWSTLDPSNAAKFYVKEPNHVFYDLSPVKYDGWAAYDAGVRKIFANTKSLTGKVNNDLRIHDHGGPFTWTAATIDLKMADKSGKETNTTARWTAIWEKMGNDWVIVHEHVSVPMPE